MIPDETDSMRGSEIVALERRNSGVILAVVYEGRRPRHALRLPEGATAETLSPGQRAEAPEHPPEVLAVATDGMPASIHDRNLGLVASHVALSGVFLLAGGEIAAVYGAEVIPLG